jgi:chorismate-pyruvate lyase
MIVDHRLTDLHFTAQHESSTDLEDVEISHLDPFLRALLFTDGTVSRALEANTLCHVDVDAVEQATSPVPARIARHLSLKQGEECIRRRVQMTVARTGLAVWAESYVLPRRLPREFLSLLDGNSHGIGGSLQQLKLESWRELLWFGLGRPPQWSDGAASATTTLTRFYRVITQRLPALLISEAFAVEMRSGVYRLTGSAETVADAAHGSAPRRLQPAVAGGRFARGADGASSLV